MSTILMYMNALNFLTINIPTQMRTFLYNETLLSVFMGKMGECCSEKSGSND